MAKFILQFSVSFIPSEAVKVIRLRKNDLSPPAEIAFPGHEVVNPGELLRNTEFEDQISQINQKEKSETLLTCKLSMLLTQL